MEERVRELGRRIEDLERAIAAKDAVLAGKEEHIRDLRELKRAWVHIERVRIEKVLNVLSNNKVRVEATAKADLGLSEIVFQAIRRLGKVAVGIGKSLATAPESVRTKGRAFIEAARRLASELSVRVQGSEAIEHLQRELESVSSDTQASKKIDARSLPDLAVFRDRLSDGTEGPKMAILPAGRFLMGSPAKEKGRYKDEGPRREVVIGRRFALGRSPVTVMEYTAFRVATGHEPPDGEGRLPVTGVSWEDARDYCLWLGETTGAAYRLPSEAEWEYACRAGTKTAYWWGETWDASEANGREDGPGRATEAGRYPANPWGLYDVSGNVREWCADAWRDDYAEPRTQEAVDGPSDARRVARGGSWFDFSQFLRSAVRDGFVPDLWGDVVGFRAARTLLPPSP